MPPLRNDAMPALPADRDRAKRWLIALAIALIACALQWSVRSWAGTRVPFLFFLPAILVTATLAGRAAAVAVAGAGFVNALYWLPPEGLPSVGDAADQLSFLLYALVAVLLAMVGARLRSSSARMSTAEQRLMLA